MPGPSVQSVASQPTHAQLVSTPRSNMLSLPLFQRQVSILTFAVFSVSA